MKVCEGIRVLDLTQVLAGPYCTSILADMGAEVIKIEKPGKGDDARSFPPFKNGKSIYFANLNRGKKSIVLNLKSQEGCNIFLNLVEKSDILIENFTPGTLKKLGLDYNLLKTVNPRLIYASISTYGKNNTHSCKPGYDIIAQALGGLMSITGWPHTPPTRTGTAIADVLAGLNGCIGILAALRSREITGRGQEIDISLIDSIVSGLENLIILYTTTGEIPTRIGNRYEFIYPYDSFKTLDGWVVIASANDEIWLRLCKTLERPDLVADPRLTTNALRIENHTLLKDLIERWTKKRSTQEIVEKLSSYQIPCSQINTIKDVVDDIHISQERKMILDLEDPKAGTIKVISSPVKMSHTPLTVQSPSPILGEHTEELLRNILQFSKERLKKLKIQNIIQ